MKCQWFKSLVALSAVLTASVVLTGCGEPKVLDHSEPPIEALETELNPPGLDAPVEGSEEEAAAPEEAAPAEDKAPKEAPAEDKAE